MDRLVQEFEQDFPDHELVARRSDVAGFECLIAIPKAKIAERAKEGKEPFWRHGETIHVKPHTPEASDG